MISNELNDKIKAYFFDACKTLNIKASGYSFEFEPIGKHFSTIYNSAEIIKKTLFVNEDWIRFVIDPITTYNS